MLDTLIPIGALVVAVFLGMFAADKFVAFVQQPRYTLRTLFIATTLIALVLGLVVWSTR